MILMVKHEAQQQDVVVSYPYLKLARGYGLDYADVLFYSQVVERGPETKLSVWEMQAMLQIAELHDEDRVVFHQAVMDAIRHFKEIKAGTRNPWTGELYEVRGTKQ